MPPTFDLKLTDLSGAVVKRPVLTSDGVPVISIKTASVEPGAAGEEFRIPIGMVDGGLAADKVRNPRGYTATSGSGIDATWPSFFTLPPKTNGITLSSAVAMASNGEVRMAVEFASNLFIMSGRYIHSVNTSHTVSTSLDLGSGDIGTWMTVVDDNLFVCCGNTDFVQKRTSGGSWSASADVYAQVILPTRRTIWRVRNGTGTIDNSVSGIDANTSTLATAMMTNANWTSPGSSAGYVVGDNSYQVLWGVEYQGGAWFGRADGMFQNDTEGNYFNRTPQLRESPNIGNALGAAVIFGSLFVPSVNRGLLRVRTGESIAVGPEQIGTPNKSWWVRSMVEHNRAAYLLATDEQGTRQSVLKMVPDDLGISGQEYIFHELQDVVGTNKSPWLQIFQATTNPELFWGGGSATTTATYSRLGRGGGRDIDDGCFPAETPVSAETSPVAVMRRWYSGDLTEITTSKGHKLTGTPNHPVLTDRGWVGLSHLKVGDNVVYDRRAHERESVRHPDVERPNATLGEIFDLASVWSSGERRSLVGQNFHGDGQKGEVDVVAMNGELWDRIKARLFQPATNDDFVSGSVRLSTLDSNRAPNSLSISGVSALSGSMATSQAMNTITGGLSASSDSLPFGHSSHGNSSTPEVSKYRGVVNAVISGNSLSGVTVTVPLCDIVGVRRIPFSGHVYNLQTVSNQYAASGVIVHNSYQYAAAGELITGNIRPSAGRSMQATLHGVDVYTTMLGSSPSLTVTYNVDDFVGAEPATTMYTNREAATGSSVSSSGRARFYATTSGATGSTFNFKFALAQGGTPAGTTRSMVHEAYAFGVLKPFITDYIQLTLDCADGDGVGQNGIRIGKRAKEVYRQCKAWQRDNSVLTMNLAEYEEDKTVRVIVVDATEGVKETKEGTNRPKKNTAVTLVLKRMDYAGAYGT